MSEDFFLFRVFVEWAVILGVWLVILSILRKTVYRKQIEKIQLLPSREKKKLMYWRNLYTSVKGIFFALPLSFLVLPYIVHFFWDWTSSPLLVSSRLMVLVVIWMGFGVWIIVKTRKKIHHLFDL